jgi:hypothetical protein
MRSFKAKKQTLGSVVLAVANIVTTSCEAERCKCFNGLQGILESNDDGYLLLFDSQRKKLSIISCLSDISWFGGICLLKL